MYKEIMKNRKWLVVLLLVGTCLIVPAVALSWPSNHVDSSTTGDVPYCTSCHTYETGYLTIETINGKVPRTNAVTVTRGGSFNMTYRTVGLGYGRFTVAGALQVADASKWTMSQMSGGDVPWARAEQSTMYGAPVESPYIWVTAFPATTNPNGQKGVTLDDGSTSGPYIDRNGTAHDEVFSVNVKVDDQMPFGTYNLRVLGIGTSSTGRLGYNEQTVAVTVYDDTTPPDWSPSKTANIRFSNQTAGSVTITWDPASDPAPNSTGVDGYEIYRATSASGPYEYIGYSTSTSYTDRELLAETTYYYMVTAVDKCGNVSPYSFSSSTTTLAPPRTDGAAPLAPQGLKASLTENPLDPSKRIVRLEWSANTEGDIIGYHVYRSTEPAGNYARLTQTPCNSTVSYQISSSPNVVMKAVYFTDSTVKYGTTYYYKVVAVDVAGKMSAMSSYVSATPTVDYGVSPHGNYKSSSNDTLCQNCHSTHSSRGAELIYYSSITDSCYTCHDGSQSKYNTKAAFDPVNNPSHHKVPEGRYSCDVCHNPHYSSPMVIQKDGDTVTETVYRLLSTVSKEDGRIKRRGNDFCWACHGLNSDLPNPFGQDHKTAFINSKHNTLEPSSTLTGITCRNCHAPHGSKDYPLIITSNSANFCITCHKDHGFTSTKVLNDDGTVKTGVYLWNQSNNYLGTTHEQNFYGRNTCTMCHEPHGHISNRYMLRNYYNDKFTTTVVNSKVYGPVEWNANWNTEKETICFRCHDSQYYTGINGNMNPTVGSNFGNGNGKNYHTHVKWKVSCRACHDPHSGKSMFNNSKPGWTLDNGHYISFDWAVQVGIAVYSTAYTPNRLAYIPAYGVNLQETGFSCAIKCHNYDHYVSGGTYKSYIRTGNSPALKCAACHDFDTFDRNSRHPVLQPGPVSQVKVTCEQCHLEDHTLHNSTNPYGLRATVTSSWVYKPDSTTLGTVIDPDTGEEVPAYKEFCWHCHGTSPDQRTILSDQKSKFAGKKHSLLERDASSNPYGPGIDNPCLKCHEHHASTNVRLLRKTIDGVAIDAATDNGKIYACMACHDGYPGEVDISSKYNAASHGGHYIKANPTKKLLCTECHDPHGTDNVSYLLDTSNKYQTGITFPNNISVQGKSRQFCLACHPTSDQPARVYNTVYTIKVGQVTIQPLPYPDRIADHKSTGTRECVICHDPHKPWPPTGGEDKCYNCHSSDGEAVDIRALAGLEGVYPGLQSHHRITDADTKDNTCMTRCHKPHPHDPRADLIKEELPGLDERSLCLKCHSSVADAAYRSPYTINVSLYTGTPHDYEIPIKTFSDNSTFRGNCDKCHVPHGSMFPPLLKLPKDELCVDCHNGQTRDGKGDLIPDLKTQYEAKGHRYKNYPTAKMYCAECHVPHGSTNNNYLRDKNSYARNQTITWVYQGVSQQVYFPENMNNVVNPYKPRQFCITCHKEYTGEGVSSYVYYTSETSPGVNVKIDSIPLVGPNGVTIPEHWKDNPTQCTVCHNPHDPDPVGSDYNCFTCHGENGYTTRIQNLTGFMQEVSPGVYQQTWPYGVVAKTAYHPITDANSKGTNDCMLMCHKPHMHNPRSSMLKDKRPTAGDVEAPENPRSLYAQATSAVAAEVYWAASQSPDVYGYYVYRKVGVNGTWTKYGTVNSKVYNEVGQTTNMVWFEDGGLKPGVPVWYQVYARDYNDNVNYEVTFVVPVTVTPGLSSDHTAPTVPTNLKVSVPESAGSTRLTLSWTASTDNYKVVQYHVYRGTTSDFTEATGVLAGTTGLTSFTDSGLTPEKGYYYKVKAVDDNGNFSALTAPVYGQTLSADNYVTKGYYTEGDTVFEILDVNANHTTEFPLGSNAVVKVKRKKSAGGLNPSASNQVLFKDHLGNTKATYTSAVYTESEDGLWDILSFNIQLPTTDIYSGAYVVQASVYTNGGLNIKPYQVIKYGATVKGFRFYKDAARTKEAFVFEPGQRVYAKVFTDNPGGTTQTYYTPSLTWKDFDDTTGTSLTITWETPQYEYGSAKFNFVLPQLTSSGGPWNDGWWYNIHFYAQGYARRRYPDVANYGAMLMVKKADTTAPEGVSSGPVLTPGTTTMRLSWGASANTAGDLGGYNVYRALQAGGPYYLAGSTTTTGFMDYGLKPGTTYYYQVKAVDLHGNQSTASTVSAATLPYNLSDDTTPPNKPRNLIVQAGGRNEMVLSWSNPLAETDGVVAYAIYRSRNNIEYLRVGETENLTFTDTGLRGNTLYYYRIAAYDRSGNMSELTAPVSAITARTGDDSIELWLCMSCHEQGKAQPADYNKFTVNHKITAAYYKSKHNVDFPVYKMSDNSQYESNCTKCHVPHGSDYKHLLRAPDDNNLCFICHTNPSASGRYAGAVEYNKTAHGKAYDSTDYVFHVTYSGGYTPRYWVGERVYEDAGRCYNCHDPHGRFVPGTENTTREYIKSSANAGTGQNLNPLCYGCHGDAYAYGEYGGKTVYEKTYHGNSSINPSTGVPYNSKMRLADYGNGECINCHEPHKDAEGAMLRYPVNETGDNKNLLCLKCHDREDVVADTGLFDGSKVYNNSKHGLNAQWLADFNTPIVYNKTVWEKGVCLNCHNSHGRTTDGSTDPNKVIPKMLVMNDGPNSEICNKCHEYPAIKAKTVGYPGFSVFSQGVHKAKAQWPGGTYYPEGNYSDVKGKCINCHDPHGTAVIDAWGNVTNIVGNVFDWEEKVCYTCHDGQAHPEYGIPAIANLKFWEDKGIGHLPGGTFLVHSFDEDIRTAERHVECLDCHNVHAVQDMNASEPLTTRLSKAFKGVSGVKVIAWPSVNTPDPNSSTWKNNPYAIDGYTYQFVDDVTTEVYAELREYMVCFKCHSSYSGATSGGKRIHAYLNPNNVTTHGFSFTKKTSFVNAKINSNAQYLFPSDPTKPGYAFHPSNPNRRFNITCSDCHGNGQLTDPATGQTLPRGPHGSNADYILRADPRSADFCNLCHPAGQYGGSAGAASDSTNYTNASSAHKRSSHYAEPSTSYVPEATHSLFESKFGANYCRYCHFAGYMMGSTQYASTHGENAAFLTAVNSSYKAVRGMNGFYINYVNTSTRSCYMKHSSGYYCQHSSTASY
ncbi:cytochrome C family protein [Thermincola potens JR]|uniref:Cytochrome C family protein n=2 Tax=Thermincola TaxID=278993 RepID=D5XE19_THEPJ|nr:cytochrome C family protein [Thermincola potens JR]